MPSMSGMRTSMRTTSGSVSAATVSASRPELRGQGRRLRPLLIAAVLGGATGMALLLLTPTEAFERIVPWLIAGASAAILVQRPARELAFAD